MNGNEGKEAAQRERLEAAVKAAGDESRNYFRETKTLPEFLYQSEVEPIRDDMLSEARVFPDRFAMIKALATGGVGAEVGTRRGDFAKFMLENINPESLALFDLKERRIYNEVRNDPRTTIYIGDSSTMLAKCADRSFDWIYIDADHSLEGVRKDTVVACKKIKVGGIIMFDDYIRWSPMEMIPYGIMSVANELANRGNPVIGVALETHGYNCIALRYTEDAT